MPPRPNRRNRAAPAADLGLVLIALIWGLNFVVVKRALDEIEPLAFNALRFLLASVAVGALLRSQGRRMLPRPRDWGKVFLLALAGHVLFQFCFIFGLEQTLAGNAALLLATCPLWVVLLGSLLGRERFSGAVACGAACTFGGAVLLVVGGSDAVGGSTEGDLLMVGAAILWALYTIFGRRMVKRHGALETTAWTLWAGTPFVVAAGLPGLARTELGSLSPATWAALVHAGVLAVAVAYAIWYRSVGAIGQSRTAVYQNLVPVFALLAAWAWLNETPGRVQLAGAGVIIAGLVVARRGGGRKTRGDKRRRESRSRRGARPRGGRRGTRHGAGGHGRNRSERPSEPNLGGNARA